MVVVASLALVGVGLITVDAVASPRAWRDRHEQEVEHPTALLAELASLAHQRISRISMPWSASIRRFLSL